MGSRESDSQLASSGYFAARRPSFPREVVTCARANAPILGGAVVPRPWHRPSRGKRVNCGRPHRTRGIGSVSACDAATRGVEPSRKRTSWRSGRAADSFCKLSRDTCTTFCKTCYEHRQGIRHRPRLAPGNRRRGRGPVLVARAGRCLRARAGSLGLVRGWSGRALARGVVWWWLGGVGALGRARGGGAGGGGGWGPSCIYRLDGLTRCGRRAIGSA